MERFDALLREHREMSALLADVRLRLIPAALRRDARDVRGTLSVLAGKLTVHLAREDASLYPALHERPSQAARDAAARLQADVVAIRDAFARYLERWPTNVHVEREADDFVRDTRGIAKLLEERFAREEAEMASLADALPVSVGRRIAVASNQSA